MDFLDDLAAWQGERLAPIVAAGRTDLTGGATGDPIAMLRVALANEVSVSELAAIWVPTTRALDVKLAFARQAGDEANHFNLVADRLAAHGVDAADFEPPADHPLFTYLRGLTGTVERIAAGLFTLEAIAVGVNENFMAACAARGDDETVRVYRDYIQPDERAHQALGRTLLGKYATTDADRTAARTAIGRVLEIAAATRAAAAARLGTAALPGC